MDVRKQKLSCEEIRKTDMVDYLSRLGFEPKKIRNENYWYLSPLRNEKTPSFKINRKINCWYDHGIGKGGNLIDFAILFHNCTVGEFLKTCQNNFSFHQISLLVPSKEDEDKSRIQIIYDKTISSLLLIRYLHKRNIPLSLAEKYCREIIFRLYNKIHVVLGFKNDSGGYELRNEFFKAAAVRKVSPHLKIRAKKFWFSKVFLTSFLSSICFRKKNFKTPVFAS